MQDLRTELPSPPSLHRSRTSNGLFTPRSRSPAQSQSCGIWPATPIASPSPTSGWSPPTMVASASAGRAIASTAPNGWRRSRLPSPWKYYLLYDPNRWKTMTPPPHESTRRFLMHVLPKGFHRIRHYGLFANGNRAESIATARELLAVATPETEPEAASTQQSDQPRVLPRPCPCCGGRMIVIELFAPGCEPSWRPMPSR